MINTFQDDFRECSEVKISFNVLKTIDLNHDFNPSECNISLQPEDKKPTEILIELPICENDLANKCFNLLVESEQQTKIVKRESIKKVWIKTERNMTDSCYSDVDSDSEDILSICDWYISPQVEDMKRYVNNETITDLPIPRDFTPSLKCESNLEDVIVGSTTKENNVTNSNVENEVLIEFPVMMDSPQEKRDTPSNNDGHEIVVDVPFTEKSWMLVSDTCKSVDICEVECKSDVKQELDFNNIIESRLAQQDLTKCAMCNELWSNFSDYEKHLKIGCPEDTKSIENSMTNISNSSSDNENSVDNKIALHSDHEESVNKNTIVLPVLSNINNYEESVFMKHKEPVTVKHETSSLVSDDWTEDSGDEPIIESDTELFECVNCGKWFPSKMWLVSHRCDKSKEFELLEIQKKSKTYDCKPCGEIFDTWKMKEEHLRNCHTEKYECTYCQKLFVWKPALKKHMRGHFPKTREHCPICNKAYVSTHGLDTHIIRVHGPGPSLSLKCDICDKCFFTHKEYTNHVARHGQPKKTHKCEICVKRFTQIKKN